MITSLSSTTTGWRKPNSRMEAATASTPASFNRGLRSYGLMETIGRTSTSGSLPLRSGEELFLRRPPGRSNEKRPMRMVWATHMALSLLRLARRDQLRAMRTRSFPRIISEVSDRPDDGRDHAHEDVTPVCQPARTRTRLHARRRIIFLLTGSRQTGHVARRIDRSNPSIRIHGFRLGRPARPTDWERRRYPSCRFRPALARPPDRAPGKPADFSGTFSIVPTY